jgi:protein ImuB
VNAPVKRLWLAIRFFDLPLTALKMEGIDETPVVVVEKKRVVYVNPIAEEAGAELGMDMTTAQLLCGSDIVERDKGKEAASLHELSEQLYQFSPHITQYCSSGAAQSGLLLEISSCLKLFGGLKSFCDKISHYLEKTVYGFDLALAHSAKASWYLSFTFYEVTGDETKADFIERLNRLPIELFFDYPKAIEALSKTGFRTFGDLAIQIAGKTISSFKKRLGHEFTDALCEIYDIDQDFLQSSLFEKPRENYKPDEWFEEEYQFEFPVTLVDQLKPAFEGLLLQLIDYLRKRQQQCQSIEWRISDIYKRKKSVHVNSDTPQSHWQLLYDLTLIQFDNQELPFEVDVIKLECRNTTAVQHRSLILEFDQSKRRSKSVQDYAVVIAKLKTRLGDAAVYKLSYKDHCIPEISNVMISIAERCNQEIADVHLTALRPTWLLPVPEPIEERDKRLYWNGYLTPQVGPERIVSNWWKEKIARDYYLAVRHDNFRVWIFHDLYTKKWYVQGVFA